MNWRREKGQGEVESKVVLHQVTSTTRHHSILQNNNYSILSSTTTAMTGPAHLPLPVVSYKLVDPTVLVPPDVLNPLAVPFGYNDGKDWSGAAPEAQDPDARYTRWLREYSVLLFLKGKGTRPRLGRIVVVGSTKAQGVGLEQGSTDWD